MEMGRIGNEKTLKESEFWKKEKDKEEKKERGQKTGVAEGKSKMLHAFGRPIDPPNDLYFA